MAHEGSVFLDGEAVVLRVARLDEILPLRHRELRPGLPLEAAVFDGDTDASTRHFGAFVDGAAVACASLMARPWHGEPAWQLRGMATRADVVRHGLGSALLRFVEGAAGDPPLLWCNARLGAVPFYERQGWTVASARFEIAGVGPHHAMVRRPRTCGAPPKR
jgi:GNAT superfamily N-acetyltransferase